MKSPSVLAIGFALGMSACLPRPGLGQTITLPFPSGTAGYDQQLGVTVQSRVRPGFDTAGIQLGGFAVRPSVDETLEYNSNPTGIANKGSAVSVTSAAVAAGSLWSRNSLSATAGVSHSEYFNIPGLQYTDWNVGVAGGYTIVDSQLALAYSHQTFHVLGTTLGMVSSVTPVEDQVDTARLGYTFTFNRLSISPELSASAYQFGSASVLGVQVDQKFLNRDVIAGGVTARYALTDVSSLIVLARGIESVFVNPQAGVASNDSTSGQLLGGLDFQADGAFRYQALVGGEVRSFRAANVATRTTPIVAANVIWTPTGVLTVTGSLSRSINDPESGGTSGFVLTQASLRGDYELRRDVLLQAHTRLQFAEFFQQGSQNSFNVGAGAQWLINRNLRSALGVDYTQQSGGSSAGLTTADPTARRSGAFTQTVVSLSVHLSL